MDELIKPKLKIKPTHYSKHIYLFINFIMPLKHRFIGIWKLRPPHFVPGKENSSPTCRPGHFVPGPFLYAREEYELRKN